MPSWSNPLIILVLSGMLLAPPPPGVQAQTFQLNETPSKTPQGGTSLNQQDSQRQAVSLDPFFLVLEEGARSWVERVIVTLEVARPENYPKLDLSGPNFRKILYDCLRSEVPENVLGPEAISAINQRLGVRAVVAVRMSRSILILR